VFKDLRITSPAFEDGAPMPERYSGIGDDISPELHWTGVPEGTQQLVVVCHDPDAPLPWGFTHWVVTGIPADATGIAEGAGASYVQGPNQLGRDVYRGPTPPPGHGEHRYYFWLYALDTTVTEPLSRREFLDTYGTHVIEQARLVGTFRR
jgi:Raf kinase inhibitor-like YbhB/YbcL family protein